jgi:hypothetical protein
MLLHRILPYRASTEAEERWVDHAAGVSVKRLRDEIQMFELLQLDPDRHDPRDRWVRAKFAAARAHEKEERNSLQQATAKPAGSEEDAEAEASSALHGGRTHFGSAHSPELQFPERPATDAEWHASLRRVPGRTRSILERCMPRWDESTPTSTLEFTDGFLRLRLQLGVFENFGAAIESDRQRLTAEAAEAEACETGTAGPATPAQDADPPPFEPVSLRIAKRFVERCRSVPAWVGLLSLLEDYARTHDDPASFPKRPWDKTYQRDGTRCMAPGCTSRARIDDHHVQHRSQQGSDDMDNQISSCKFHHLQGAHGRYASVTGKAPLDLVWTLGAGGFGGRYRNERSIPGRSTIGGGYLKT